MKNSVLSGQVIRSISKRGKSVGGNTHGYNFPKCEYILPITKFYTFSGFLVFSTLEKNAVQITDRFPLN